MITIWVHVESRDGEREIETTELVMGVSASLQDINLG